MMPTLVFLVVLAALLFGPLRKAVFRKRPWRRWPSSPATNDVADPRNQLAFVSRVRFETQPLLNKAEFQVLLILEKVVRDMNAGFRVMAQTSLGEILRPKPGAWKTGDDNLAYRSINSKRADFVIVDRYGIAALVVEYQGSGHYQGNAALRDVVKREALTNAGVALLEVPARYNRDGVAGEVRRTLLRHAENGRTRLSGKPS
jgi:hypothetical protein